MDYITGQTITEVFVSTDAYNNPVVPTSFSAATFQNGLEVFSGSVNFNLSLVDTNLGIYNFSITPLTEGIYQVYINNLMTNTIYISDTYSVYNFSSPPIYIGI